MKLEKQKLTEIAAITRNWLNHKYLIISAIFIALGQLFFWLSFEDTLASIASPITSSQVVFVVIIAWLFLKEKIETKNLIGILFVVSGVIGISIISI